MSMDVTLRIKRFNPELDQKAHFEEYSVNVEPTDRVLDTLNQVKWYQDGTLTYRRSCAHGICGSDAMRINGRNRLACKVLMKDLGKRITLEPLIGFKVEKDLLVDMEGFFDSYKSIKPYLIADSAPGAGERLQSPEERATVRRYDQVHPLCRLYHLLPGDVGHAGVRRAGRDRQRAPVHFRQPGPGSGRSAAYPELQHRCLALPDGLQLHRCLPARHQGHRSDRAGKTRPAVRARLTRLI